MKPKKSKSRQPVARSRQAVAKSRPTAAKKAQKKKPSRGANGASPGANGSAGKVDHGPGPTLNGLHGMSEHLRECQDRVRRQLDELKARGDQLTSAHHFNDRLFDDGPISYAIVDAAGRIHRLNASAAEMLGVVGTDVTDKPLAAHLHPSSRQVFLDHVRSISADGRSATCELLLQNANVEIPVLTISRRIPAGYARGHIRMALMDLSVRRQIEVGLREAAERLAAANLTLATQAEQLRQMSAQLTHAEQKERARIADLIHDHVQQLLVACRMGLDVMISRRPELAQHGQELVQILQDAISALRSLSAELRPPALRERGLCAAMEWLGGWMHDKHGLDVRVTTDPDADELPDDIRETLYQTVRELLFNTAKHSGVTEAELIVSYDEHRDEVMVTVRDRGSGFDCANLAACGDGTGLFNIRHRLQAMGASLEVQSKLGKGTAATIKIPRDPHPPQFEPPPFVRARKPGAGDRARIRVLIADDHALVRQGISALLRLDEGIDVVGEAANGRAAIESVNEHVPDLVLMDVNMPEINGVEATRRIKAEFPHIHVVGLSMHTEKAMADAMREAGAEGYISKDAPSDELLAAIRKQVRARGGTNR